MFGNNNRSAEVTFYAANTGMQTVQVQCQDPQGAKQLVESQYGDVQIMRVNMNV
tara:strand:- start:423 stop:584 length:162 start_codon:yes stop_codon:yes gene_type:complete